MERHRRRQPHVQKLLDPIDILQAEESQIRAPMGVDKRMIKISLISTIDLQRSRCKGWFLCLTPYTYKIAPIVLPRNRMNDVLTELYVGQSDGHVCVKESLDQFRQMCYWFQAGTDIENFCRQCENCSASYNPRTKDLKDIH
jgi:hypothetical protein